MKKKTGFTLAEVLITLAIIGIIAALVLPALLNNFQFRAVGTRLSKFMSTVENNARAYVETTGALDPRPSNAAAAVDNPATPQDDTLASGFANLDAYIRSAFSAVDIDGGSSTNDPNTGRTIYEMPAGHNGLQTFQDSITSTNVNEAPLLLKDGTRVNFFALDDATDAAWGNEAQFIPNQGQIGLPALGIVFDPAANALPAAVRRIFGFVVTELGYVYPAPGDICTWDLYNARWSTRPEQFADGQSCGRRDSLDGSAPTQGGNG